MQNMMLQRDLRIEVSHRVVVDTLDRVRLDPRGNLLVLVRTIMHRVCSRVVM